MLGLLISESAEIVFSVVKLTFETGRGVYYWYYGEEKPENKKIHELEDRIVHLESQLQKID